MLGPVSIPECADGGVGVDDAFGEESGEELEEVSRDGRVGGFECLQGGLGEQKVGDGDVGNDGCGAGCAQEHAEFTEDGAWTLATEADGGAPVGAFEEGADLAGFDEEHRAGGVALANEGLALGEFETLEGFEEGGQGGGVGPILPELVVREGWGGGFVGTALLQHLGFPPFQGVIKILENLGHGGFGVGRKTSEDLPLDGSRHLGEGELESHAVSETSDLGETHGGGRIEATDPTEIEEDGLELGREGICGSGSNIVEERIGGAEENEALEFEDMESAAMGFKQALVGGRTLDIALDVGAGEDMGDDADAAVIVNEEEHGGEQAESNAFEVTEGGHDGDDQDHDAVIGAAEFRAAVIEPFDEEVKSLIEEDGAEDEFGNEGESLRAGEQGKTAEAGGDDSGSAGAGTEIEGEFGKRE